MPSTHRGVTPRRATALCGRSFACLRGKLVAGVLETLPQLEKARCRELVQIRSPSDLTWSVGCILTAQPLSTSSECGRVYDPMAFITDMGKDTDPHGFHNSHGPLHTRTFAWDARGFNVPRAPETSQTEGEVEACQSQQRSSTMFCGTMARPFACLMHEGQSLAHGALKTPRTEGEVEACPSQPRSSTTCSGAMASGVCHSLVLWGETESVLP